MSIKVAPERPRIQTVVRAALAMALVEVLLTFARSFDLFLGQWERIHFVVTSVSLWLGVMFAGHLGMRAAGTVLLTDRTRARVFALLAVPVAAWVVWGSTSGRRVIEVRELFTLVLAPLCGLVTYRVTLRLLRAEPSWGWYRLLFAFAAAALAADAFVLPRLYPVFHVGLVVFAVALAVGATLVSPGREFEGRSVGALLFVGFTTLALSAMWSIGGAANTRFVVQSYAPLVGKIVAFFPRDEADVVEPREDPTRDGEDIAGPDLRGQSVLLITVDALRADALSDELTPSMSALAREGVRFRRAYTPTPHTSYALSSLLTGKYLRPVLSLPGEVQEHASLPGILRQYGYRTAAFYPPAIFFVDTARFGALAEGGFDFEYRKTMFAPAAARPGQLERYLDELGEEDRPVFAWVHLFEPHEPYAPPPEYARGSSARERYDGEVAAADAAIGDLVRVFRAARPDATVIVSADHGEEFGDHGGYHHGTTLYDEQAAVPLIWVTPGVDPREEFAPVELIDITTTLLASMGIPRDARMRGDDLGGLLVSERGTRPLYAFAEVGEERMVADENYKAICGSGTCRLYDRRNDPQERHNLAGAEPEQLGRMRAALRAFTRSIPEVEAMALDANEGWPPALAEAELGEGDGDALLPLLGSGRSAVRAAAARLLGRMAHEAARIALARMSREDGDAEVRLEALLSAAVLGDDEARVELARVLDETRDGTSEWRRRAALCATEFGAVHVSSLVELLDDEAAPEGERRRAAEALGRAARHADAAEAEASLVRALGAVNLRVVAAEALTSFHSLSAGNALAAQLEGERYLSARTAEAAALAERRDRRAAALIRRWLGTDEPMPRGVELLHTLGAASRPRGPEWRCAAEGCLPGQDATLEVPAAGVAQRLVVWVRAPGELRLGPSRLIVREDAQLELLVPAGDEASIVPVSGNALVGAFVIVPQTEELPPPPPEPWGEAAEVVEGAVD